MSLWDRIKAALGQEGDEDVKDVLRHLGESMDDALAKKERELAADPAERFDMALDEAEEANRRLDELVDTPDEGTPAAGAPEAPHRLLDPADVSSSPHLQAALGWVTVEPTQEADPMCGRCGHAVWLEHRAAALVDAELDNVAAAVRAHPLVGEVLPGDSDVLYVAAPTLHHEDVRLLVAAAMADRLPDGWRTTTPPDLSI